MPSLREAVAALARNVNWSHHNTEDEETVKAWLKEEEEFEAETAKAAEAAETAKTPPKKEGGK